MCVRVEAMVRESHGGAGQGVTLIRVVVRATRAWKSSAGTSGKCENGATSEARVWRGTSAYPRSPRAGPLWQACGVGRAACCGSATMGWRAVAPWWAMALMIETTSASSSNLQFWRNSQNPLFGEAALSCFMATRR